MGSLPNPRPGGGGTAPAGTIGNPPGLGIGPFPGNAGPPGVIFGSLGPLHGGGGDGLVVCAECRRHPATLLSSPATVTALADVARSTHQSPTTAPASARSIVGHAAGTRTLVMPARVDVADNNAPRLFTNSRASQSTGTRTAGVIATSGHGTLTQPSHASCAHACHALSDASVPHTVSSVVVSTDGGVARRRGFLAYAVAVDGPYAVIHPWTLTWQSGEYVSLLCVRYDICTLLVRMISRRGLTWLTYMQDTLHVWANDSLLIHGDPLFNGGAVSLITERASAVSHVEPLIALSAILTDTALGHIVSGAPPALLYELSLIAAINASDMQPPDGGTLYHNPASAALAASIRLLENN